MLTAVSRLGRGSVDALQTAGVTEAPAAASSKPRRCAAVQGTSTCGASNLFVELEPCSVELLDVMLCAFGGFVHANHRRRSNCAAVARVLWALPGAGARRKWANTPALRARQHRQPSSRRTVEKDLPSFRSSRRFLLPPGFADLKCSSFSAFT